eukprot:scaffold2434_cov116-Isochrysis_galbana.AAC.4
MHYAACTPAPTAYRQSTYPRQWPLIRLPRDTKFGWRGYDAKLFGSALRLGHRHVHPLEIVAIAPSCRVVRGHLQVQNGSRLGSFKRVHVGKVGSQDERGRLDGQHRVGARHGGVGLRRCASGSEAALLLQLQLARGICGRATQVRARSAVANKMHAGGSALPMAVLAPTGRQSGGRCSAPHHPGWPGSAPAPASCSSACAARHTGLWKRRTCPGGHAVAATTPPGTRTPPAQSLDRSRPSVYKSGWVCLVSGSVAPSPSHRWSGCPSALRFRFCPPRGADQLVRSRHANRGKPPRTSCRRRQLPRGGARSPAVMESEARC